MAIAVGPSQTVSSDPIPSTSTAPPLPIPLPSDCEEVIDNQNNIDTSRFDSTIVASFSSDILFATDEELDLLGQVVLSIFNKQNIFNSNLCDPKWRFVYAVTVETGFAFRRLRTLESRQLDSPTLEQPFHRRLRRRLIDEDPTTANSTSILPPGDSTSPNSTSTSPPSAEPSSTSSSAVHFEDGIEDLLFTITGSCSDCDDDLNLLSHDVVERRSSRHHTRTRKLLAQLVPEDASCSCSVDAISRSPTANEFLSELSVAVDTLPFVTEVFSVVEVDVEECPDVDLEIFETVQTVPIDLADVFSNDMLGNNTVLTSEFEDAVVCSYNQLISQRFCDPAFRSVLSATYTTQQVDDIDGRLSYTFLVEMKCQNCTGILFHPEGVDVGSVFDTSTGNDEQQLARESFVDQSDGRSELLEKCFCISDTQRRAPTRSEFEAAFQLCDGPFVDIIGTYIPDSESKKLLPSNDSTSTPSTSGSN